ncbi:polysaccharide deacetylase family protein [Pseudonocardia sp. TRM90224]|uniref:polysaccharide deacetylase family protein n=1 Tax=Pseudonocardia sp. TRM90224 TaxID=2812678 RepID=UPI001E542033|nr:polysaccharide deacetylase family protein [Pseudonocardia sp. TRM90224]
MSILCYHSVARGWDDPVSVEPDDFDQQCAALSRSTDVVPLPAVVDRLAAGGSVPRGQTVLTFDDGFADYVEHAVPIMEKHGLTATMYIVAGSITDSGVEVNWITGLDAAKAPPLMTREQIVELHQRGWDIGSHTMAHRDLPTLSEAECLADLTESRELLSDLLGAAVTTLAYPFGHHAPHVRRAAEQAGYACAVALPDAPEEAGPFSVPRTGIYRGNPMWKFRVKTSGWYAGVRTSPLYRLVGS